MHTDRSLPIEERLGIEFPLFAFSHCRDVVAAVSRAGGFGVLGALAFDAEQLEAELSWIDEHAGGRPYGVDFAMPQKFVGQGTQHSPAELEAMIPPEHREFTEKLLADHGVPPSPDDDDAAVVATGLRVEVQVPGQLKTALNHPVSMIINALGPPPEYAITAAHAKGILVGALCGTPEHARRNVAAGVDVVIAQGTEAGGHCGEISTMVLVPAVVDTVGPDVPVLAAGGVGSGRQMAAAMALGAQGVWTGSIWLTVAEASTAPWVVQNLLRADYTDTVRSRSMTGKPARQIRTAWTAAWEGPDSPGTLPMPLQGIVYGRAYRRFMRAQSPELSGSPAGQIVGSIDKIRTARDLVHDIVTEWIATTQRLGAVMARHSQQ
ncbi:nitronate monooxygenase [Mycobacterium sp. CBMA271]|uniref:NAD(P)H-dependent flavin oxidoreductase n=1 Tax=unclassified Mycobacteroides TaxID=2618759 RepID=UPI00132B80EE|nr:MULTISPECIES: nitronate monooxygenase family protein [unclassified Mycobacteroides]MUM18907.1 monooxygenase [Mycobacteroides sp. CBMA 326]MUM23153.1 nitronate monooxygenase [Mycobacteroides sp. CBMA 271]